MERESDAWPRELVDLGVASTATQGAGGSMLEAAGLWHQAGLDQD